MPTRAEYKADVERRGGYFFDSLPSTSPGISRTDAGKVGARFPKYSATGDYRFEVAPASVQLAAGVGSFLGGLVDSVTTYAAENPLGVSTWEEDLKGASWEKIKQAYEKGKSLGPKAPSLLDIIAAALGIPKSVLIVVLLLVGYAMLQNLGVVPSLRKVVS